MKYDRISIQLGERHWVCIQSPIFLDPHPGFRFLCGLTYLDNGDYHVLYLYFVLFSLEFYRGIL